MLRVQGRQQHATMGRRVFVRLNTVWIVECFLLYLEKAEVTISRAEALQRIDQKLVNTTFLPTCLRPPKVAQRAWIPLWSVRQPSTGVLWGRRLKRAFISRVHKGSGQED